MATKSEILAEIHRIASAHAGSLSLKKFLELSGLPERQVRGRYWATWNEALAEAGLSTNKFSTPKSDEALVIAALAQLIQQLGKWPTETQLTVARHNDPSFPSIHVFRRLGKEVFLPSKVLAYCSERGGPSTVKDVAQRKVDEAHEPESKSGQDAIAGYVYMMRSGKRYKIGKSTSPSRRYREVRLDLPDETLLIHTIPTDDPSGIEAYWHRRFAGKRVRDTEFFDLDASDVAAFKRRKYQ
ncbi:MAG: GIY-YIG nuclease family protein [Rubrivivax sp.]|nr:GIY-YIG nuclease family protein [Pyrinomonadaceae bacterium]